MWQTEQDIQDSDRARQSAAPRRPGLVVVWSGGRPLLRAHEVDRGAGAILGRELIDQSPGGIPGAGPELVADDRLSRQHARIRAVDAGFVVDDLGSRNGTYVDGARLVGERWVQAPAVIRTGRTISLLVDDVRPYLGSAKAPGMAPYLAPYLALGGDALIGPSLADAWRRIERAARTGDHLLLTGESGTGKELAARAYHAATGATGELVSINCAAIPAGVAERLLFGTRRGAYSGADRDADGYLVAADGGTLFLDEVGELEPAVQAKLLRALETREVVPLGAARPRKIELRVVAATLRDLRSEVAERRFRVDLYHRIGRPEVHLPPLRERREDIAWLIARTALCVAPGLTASAGLVETCLVRPWPGNARELIGEIRRASLAARDAGAREIVADDLDHAAGLRIEAGTAERFATPAVAAEPAPSASHVPAPLPDRSTIARALAAEHGNVARTARALGLHRNQLRRFLAHHPELVAEA